MKVARVPFHLKPGDCFQTPLLRAELRLRLLDTIEWCLPRARPDSAIECLRTAELKPYLFNETRHESVNQVAWTRHGKLSEEGLAEHFPISRDYPVEVEYESKRQFPPKLGGGRLLVWYRDLTIDDGVGESCTNGYLDVSDMPPWDTWVTYVCAVDDAEAAAGYLVSWVPPQFIEPVQEAIDSNAYDALFWLSNSRLLVAAVLREEDALA